MSASSVFQVIALSVVGLKRISAMCIEPKTGKPVVLKGDNEAGKSTVLDAIQLALTGEGAVNPIRHGESKAKITLEIGGKEREFTIERTYTTKGGASLVVKDKEGQQVPKPQTFLDSLRAQHTIDPLRILGMNPKEQAEALCAQLGLTEKMDDLDNAIEILMEKRRVESSNLKSIENRREAIKPAGRDVPDEMVDVAALALERDQLGTKQQEFLAANQGVITLANTERERQKDVSDCNVEIERIKKELAAAERKAVAADKALVAAKKNRADADQEIKRLAPEQEKVTARVSQVNAELANANEINEAVRQKDQRATLTQEMVAAEKKVDAFTKDIEGKRSEKVNLVKKAKLPIDGLELTDSGLLFKGEPLADLNTASQIRVSAALAMAESPQLRILFIREGALVNDENKKVIFGIAQERDYQVWMEVFSPTDEGDGIFIEEGEISTIDGKKPKKAA